MPFAPSTIAGASVAYTGTAGTTTVMKQASSVLVWATTDAYIAVGLSPTATVSDCCIPAYTPVVFDVPVGDGSGFKVSAIQLSAGGTVYAKPGKSVP